MIDLQVKTMVDGTTITQEVTGPEHDWLTNTREVLSRRVSDTMDRQFRDALIALGWTPPPGPA